MSETHSMQAGALPARHGPPPATTRNNPQQQTEQIPTRAEHDALVARVMEWPDVIKKPSGRAPPGTIGLFLTPQAAKGPEEAFLLDTEFAHLHPLPDGSLHMVLPEAMRDELMAKGWGIPHPMAGMPSVSRSIVLVYAPRDADERETVVTLIAAAEAFARGR